MTLPQLDAKKYGFAPKFRIRKSCDFRNFKDHSYRVYLHGVEVWCLPTSLGHYRLGVTIRAKCNAVHRNKVKRQVRDIFRHHGPSLSRSIDFNVVVPKNQMIDYAYPKKIRQVLLDAFEKNKFGRSFTIL